MTIENILAGDGQTILIWARQEEVCALQSGWWRHLPWYADRPRKDGGTLLQLDDPARTWALRAEVVCVATWTREGMLALRLTSGPNVLTETSVLLPQRREVIGYTWSVECGADGEPMQVPLYGDLVPQSESHRLSIDVLASHLLEPVSVEVLASSPVEATIERRTFEARSLRELSVLPVLAP